MTDREAPHLARRGGKDEDDAHLALLVEELSRVRNVMIKAPSRS